MPTTLTVTEVSTLFVAHATATLDDVNQPVVSQRFDPVYPPPIVVTNTVKDPGKIIDPTPVLPGPGVKITQTVDVITSSHPYVSATPPSKLPLEKFIVRTILHSNMTIIHNKVEDFKKQMEQKLTRAYRRAYDKDKFQSRWTRSADEESEFEENLVLMFPHGRQIRSAVADKTGKKEENSGEESDVTAEEFRSPVHIPPRAKRHRTPPRVEIHNIRSALPQPEIEVLYTVYQGKKNCHSKNGNEQILKSVLFLKFHEFYHALSIHTLKQKKIFTQFK